MPEPCARCSSRPPTASAKPSPPKSPGPTRPHQFLYRGLPWHPFLYRLFLYRPGDPGSARARSVRGERYTSAGSMENRLSPATVGTTSICLPSRGRRRIEASQGKEDPRGSRGNGDVEYLYQRATGRRVERAHRTAIAPPQAPGRACRPSGASSTKPLIKRSLIGSAGCRPPASRTNEGKHEQVQPGHQKQGQRKQWCVRNPYSGALLSQRYEGGHHRKHKEHGNPPM